MSRREDTHRSSLSQPSYHHRTVPPKARDGQYPLNQKSIGLDHRYRTNEAVDLTGRDYHKWCQRRCEEKRSEQANKTAYRSFVETHDARANVDPGERHWKERHCHGGYSQGEDEARQCRSSRSTYLHSEDEDVLLESPACPNDLNSYDTRPSGFHRKPVPNDQPPTRGEPSREASLPFPHSVGSASPQPRLTRTDTYQSTDSNHSLSTVDSDDPLDEAYKNYEVESKIVKDFDRYSHGWRHRFC